MRKLRVFQVGQQQCQVDSTYARINHIYGSIYVSTFEDILDSPKSKPKLGVEASEKTNPNPTWLENMLNIDPRGKKGSILLLFKFFFSIHELKKELGKFQETRRIKAPCNSWFKPKCHLKCHSEPIFLCSCIIYSRREEEGNIPTFQGGFAKVYIVSILWEVRYL